MLFRSLVVTRLDATTGLPMLVNGGKDRLRGAELESSYQILDALRWQAAISWHDDTFRDFMFDDGSGVPVQIAGNRLPASARVMAATGFTWAEAKGPLLTATANYVGSRFFDELNGAEAPSYVTFSAGAGWRNPHWEIRLDGRNLNNRRAPVSISEMGGGQYYLLPARRIDLTGIWKF